MPDGAESSSTQGELWADLQTRRAGEQRQYHGHSPKPIGNIIAQLVTRRGYAAIHAAGERQAAWLAAAGEQLATVSEVGPFRRGTLEVIVANSLLMQELTFRKEELLARLQQALPDAGLRQLRFKVGQIGR
jgi:predicted nucleic acid-binding Zn ribbon protein